MVQSGPEPTDHGMDGGRPVGGRNDHRKRLRHELQNENITCAINMNRNKLYLSNIFQQEFDVTKQMFCVL